MWGGNRNVLFGHGHEVTYLLCLSGTWTGYSHSPKAQCIPLTPQYYYFNGIASVEELIKN